MLIGTDMVVYSICFNLLRRYFRISFYVA